MRKFLFLTVLTLCLLLCATAFAQSYTFRDISATCDVSDSYILLTPDNLDQHQEWVAAQGTTKEALIEQWNADGILLEAWTTEGDACLVISAVQDDDAKQYFDLDQQSTKARAAYRSQHLNGSSFKAAGFDYQSAEWKKTSRYGRFLALKYKRTLADGTVYRGYARRAIRNGYTITLDYQVYGRTLKKADLNALEDVMDTWTFTQVTERPADAVAKAVFTSEPPRETSTGKFSVEGTCEPGLHLVGVVMRMSSPDPIRVETDASKTGKFSMDVTLPEEGVWLMTVTVENGDTVTEEIVFDPTTYQTTLLPVNLNEEIGTELTEDTLVISGKTIKNVKVQCMVDDGYDKQITTNGTGKFSFKLDTSKEGTYNITLVFAKKGYDTRRFTYSATRSLTEDDLRSQYKEEAVKPAYSTLTDKLKGYTGRVMAYNLYVTSIEQSGDQWVVFMAMTKTKSGYKNMVVVTTKEEPNFSVDSLQKMYGTCTGSYSVEEDGATKEYPAFELLFWETAD